MVLLTYSLVVWSTQNCDTKHPIVLGHLVSDSVTAVLGNPLHLSSTSLRGPQYLPVPTHTALKFYSSAYSAPCPPQPHSLRHKHQSLQQPYCPEIWLTLGFTPNSLAQTPLAFSPVNLLQRTNSLFNFLFYRIVGF